MFSSVFTEENPCLELAGHFAHVVYQLRMCETKVSKVHSALLLRDNYS